MQMSVNIQASLNSMIGPCDWEKKRAELSIRGSFTSVNNTHRGGDGESEREGREG